jgi:hypothetical protein
MQLRNNGQRRSWKPFIWPDGDRAKVETVLRVYAQCTGQHHSSDGPTATEEIANIMLDVTDENDISIEEVKKAVEHMQNYKSPRCDRLPTKVSNMAEVRY